MRFLPFIGVAVALVVVIVAMTFFRVDERQQAIVLQFGEVKQVLTKPGLNMKIPLIQNVDFYEDRILPLETQPLEVTPKDDRRLIVDAFARWRIADVVQFRRAVQNEINATNRLENILGGALREVLGSVNQAEVLSPERTVLMQRIRDVSRSEAEALGVEIVDVRIRRTDLPEQNLQFTFNRMEAERQREAADERARGAERAQEVRATARRQATEIVSDAERQAEVIRGQADAERNAIYAGAYGKDAEFFAFYRSLNAYESGLKGANSTMVITPDSEFFDYLKTDRGAFSPPATEPVTGPPPDEAAAGSGPAEEETAPDPDEPSAGPPNARGPTGAGGGEALDGSDDTPEADADDGAAAGGADAQTSAEPPADDGAATGDGDARTASEAPADGGADGSGARQGGSGAASVASGDGEAARPAAN